MCIIITGNLEERKRFLKELYIEEHLELAKIIECEYNYDDPVRLWGTKWGCYDCELNMHDQELTKIFFHTAWCLSSNSKKDVRIISNS